MNDKLNTLPERIECSNCAERNDLNNQECAYCKGILNKDEFKKCQGCGILIVSNLGLCKLCSATKAKSHGPGCILGLSVIALFIGIGWMFANFRLGLKIVAISVAVYGLVVLVIKIKFTNIEGKYNIRRKMPL